MTEQAIIDTIKTGTDLKAYIEQATGSTFKKNGKGHVCRCPFPDNEDKNPSFIVTPQEILWNCFGCGCGGDICYEPNSCSNFCPITDHRI